MRPSRRVVLIAAGAAAAAAVAFVLLRPAPRVETDARTPIRDPARAKELVVLVRPAPVVYFPGPAAQVDGLDADLLRLFAAEKKLPLRFVVVDDPAQLLARIAGGEAHLGAGGLLRPVPKSDADATPVKWSDGYYDIEPVLIYNTEGFRPANWDDLDNESIVFSDNPGREAEIEGVRAAHPTVQWQFVPQASPLELIARVSDGDASYAIADSLTAAIARNIYLDYEVAFTVGDKRQFAWAIGERFPALAADIAKFLERVKRDGTLARLIERYVPDLKQFQRLDASGLQDRARTTLPLYRHLFHDAQERTGIDWRLLAALAYQESKWDPAATSETGVRGFMQITEDTARRLGVTNLLDPGQNVLAGARYLRDLEDSLPPRIQEPDRTWLALAAYNIGLGHLEDARVLTQRQGFNPDHWTNVKKALPLLALPEHYEKSKLGYARGGMPVAFVDRVRGYYDVLLAQQAPLQPRLRLFADAPPADPQGAVAAPPRN